MKKDIAPIINAYFAKVENHLLERETFLLHAPVMLADTLNACGINTRIDKAQLELLATHTGLTGGPREFMSIITDFDGKTIYLSYNCLVSLGSDKKVLTAFVNDYMILQSLCNNILESNDGGAPKNGDVFYSDISLYLDDTFDKSHPAKNVFFHFICQYLRNWGIWVHS